MGGTVFGTPGEFVRRRTIAAGNQRAHLVEAGLQHLLRAGDSAPTGHASPCRQGSAPHKTGGPDIAINAALIAQGDTVVATGEVSFRVRETGKAGSSSWVYIWQLANGAVQSYDQFNDTGLVDAFR